MRRLVFGVVAALLISAVVGCGGKEEATKPPGKKATRRDEGGGYLDTLGRTYRRAERLSKLEPAKRCVAAFRAMKGRNPGSIEELKKEFPEFPGPPEGKKFVYDPKTGEIRLVAAE